jgi:hypothetical protein
MIIYLTFTTKSKITAYGGHIAFLYLIPNSSLKIVFE